MLLILGTVMEGPAVDFSAQAAVLHTGCTPHLSQLSFCSEAVVGLGGGKVPEHLQEVMSPH